MQGTPPPLSAAQGVDAELVSLDSIIDWDVFGEDPEAAAKSSDGPPQLSQAFYTRLSERLGERLAECGNRVPVITGASMRRRSFFSDIRC